MEWASAEQEESPSFDQLAVDKSTISDDDNFKAFVSLYGLTIIQEEDHYYILDGQSEDLLAFSNDWNWNG